MLFAIKQSTCTLDITYFYEKRRLSCVKIYSFGRAFQSQKKDSLLLPSFSDQCRWVSLTRHTVELIRYSFNWSHVWFMTNDWSVFLTLRLEQSLLNWLSSFRQYYVDVVYWLLSLLLSVQDHYLKVVPPVDQALTRVAVKRAISEWVQVINVTVDITNNISLFSTLVCVRVVFSAGFCPKQHPILSTDSCLFFGSPQKRARTSLMDVVE